MLTPKRSYSVCLKSQMYGLKSLYSHVTLHASGAQICMPFRPAQLKRQPAVPEMPLSLRATLTLLCYIT